jgi:glutamyl-tRNA synthetase
MRSQRFDGIESKNRNLSIDENIKLFEEMKNGTEKGLVRCLRAKIDMQDKNKCMRDPVIYRCNLTPHHLTGSLWKMYPTYDFACPIVDSIEGVTHALRTIEYRDRNAQYVWFLKALSLRLVHVWDFSRLNFIYTLLSKRKLTWFVEEKHVTGWDDPRFATVRGILRRGLTVEALRGYIISQGASQREISLEWDKIWTTNKKIIDPKAPRHVAVTSKDLASIRVLDSSLKNHVKLVPKHKKNLELGEKATAYGNLLFLEQIDAASLELDEEVTLMDWGNVFIRRIEKKGDKVIGVEIDLHLDGDFKKYV